MALYPPVGFLFTVKILGEMSEKDAAFLEVSGLEMEVETLELKEGGENQFSHILPGRIKHGNLVLKRGFLISGSAFTTWCLKTLQTHLVSPLDPKTIEISLLGETGNALLTWTCSRAWPVKWSAAPFQAMENNLAVETLEFAYHELQRISW